jgi:hypothetical protein
MSKTLAVVAIFKNESNIMKEWIEHYLKEGVNHFFLIDNGSNDNYLTILHPYITNGLVDLIVDDKKYAQVEHYEKYKNSCKQYKWVAIVDFDEFIYSRLTFPTIVSYLNSLSSNIDQIIIPWKMFGSGGHIAQPNGVINNFIMRQNYNITKRIMSKTIIRGDSLLKFEVHVSRSSNTHKIAIRPDLHDTHRGADQPINEEILKKSALHLNHYAIQSLEWFQHVKMTRGDVASPDVDTIRNMDYFKAYDHKDMIDNELKMKKY